MSKSWRDIARPIIYEVLKSNEGKSQKEIKKALRDAYPFGERRYHPYKIWCDEVNVQTGKKKLRIAIKNQEQNKINGQTDLFE